VHETHRTGVFSRDVWHRLLTGAGFEALVLTRQGDEDEPPRDLFIGHRPGRTDTAGDAVSAAG
jgi:hypothetical protein